MAAETDSYLTDRLVHESTGIGLDSLSDRLPLAFGTIIAILVLTTAIITAYISIAGDPSVKPPVSIAYAAAGVGILVSMVVVWSRLDTAERSAAFPFRWPSRTELALTLVFVPLGLIAFVLGMEFASLLGFETEPITYDLSNPAIAAAILFGPILISPLFEEALYRGLLMGALIGRGWSPIVAGIAALAVFAIAHVFALGVGGVFAIAALTVFPTVLRLRFDNLTGAWLNHLLNNICAYVILVAV